MREDDRSREKFAEELLDAALSNRRGAEPEDGLEDRILTRLRQQSRASRPASRNTAPVIIAAVVVLTLFAIDHLTRRTATSDPSVVAVSGAGASNLNARQTKTGEVEVAADGVKIAKAFAAARSSSRRRGTALDLNPGRAEQQAESGLRVEEVQIAEIRLDDIVIGNNERQE
jgi:hypothetical protein